MTTHQDWPLGAPRQLLPGQRTEVWIADVDAGAPRLLHTSETRLLEAPNWTPDGHSLLLNGDGLLWRLDLDGNELRPVDLEGVPPLNNDHVIDPGRGLVYVSTNDGHVWVAPLGGGAGCRVTSDNTRFHFLHGVSPDGATLAFVDLPVGDVTAAGQLALIASTGGATRYLAAGRKHLDGPEYSPDGAWLYLNTEEFSARPGHAQLARIPAHGGHLEQLVVSTTVDWFPHLSPDGQFAAYLSFPTGTRGHPPNLPVEIRLVRTSDWTTVTATYPLFGGQGTLNVNSWAPDSRHFAFVAYPVKAEDTSRPDHLPERQTRP